MKPCGITTGLLIRGAGQLFHERACKWVWPARGVGLRHAKRGDRGGVCHVGRLSQAALKQGAPNNHL